MAGAATLVFQKHPDWSPDQVKWLLVSKAGAAVSGSSLRTLTLTGVHNFTGTPGRANQGVLALVCAPGTACSTKGPVASSWNSSSWNSSSWNSSSWNGVGWESSGWSSSSWNSSSWNSSSWNSSRWNSSRWNEAFSYYSPWG